MAAKSKDDIILTQKSGNTRPSSRDQKQKFNRIPQMSPEASRAMGMVRDEAKENISSSGFNTESYGAVSNDDLHIYRGATLDSNNNENKSQSKNFAYNVIGRQRQDSVSGKRVQRLPPRFSKPPVSRSSICNNPDRSRSTLSHTDPSFSTSDNTESCNQTSSASVNTNNNSASQSGNINMGRVAFNPVEDDYYDDADEDDDELGTLSMEQDFSNGNALPVKEKSFVLALDRALERNAISRLKGDITDSAGITMPGTVRALDGGRLANAQEVVVNVCHDDDRQLVFHDDDEESLDTAKEISQIRVNIWMEYNSSFPPDNDVHDFQIPGITEDSTSVKDPSSGTLTRTSGDKTSAENRKTHCIQEGKTANIKDRKSNNKNNVNNKVLKNTPASTTRPKTIIPHPKSAKSGSSGSSRDPSQNSGPSQKSVSKKATANAGPRR